MLLRFVSWKRSVALMLGCMVSLAAPSPAHAVSEPDDLCTGDPCVIQGTHEIDPFTLLDFEARSVVIEGRLEIQSGRVSIYAGALRIAPSGSIVGAPISAPGGELEIDVAGDAVIEGTASTAIDLRGAPGGVLSILAGGSITSARPIFVSARSAEPTAGEASFDAAGDVFLDAEVEAARGSTSGSGGSLFVSAGRDARLLNVDVRGGSSGSGVLGVFAMRDVRLGAVDASNQGAGGAGGDVAIDALGSIRVEGLVTAQGATSNGDGGSVRLAGDLGNTGGAVEMLAPIRLEGGGTVACGGNLYVEAASAIAAASIGVSGDCGGSVEFAVGDALRLDPGSSIDAQSGASAAGDVRIRSGGSLRASGSIDVDGGSFGNGSAGLLLLDAGGALRVEGTLSAAARSTTSPGGFISLSACDATTLATAQVDADGIDGAVEIVAAGVAVVGGAIEAGGTFEVFYRPPVLPQIGAGSFAPPPHVIAHANLEVCNYATCGDRIRQAPEQCEDGNVVSGDGCSWSCHIERGPCNDEIDNDGDGLIDFAADPGCDPLRSRIENPKCDDGIDNDGDGRIDWDGVPPDPPCVGKPWNDSERPPSSCGLGAELAIAGLLALRMAPRAPKRRSGTRLG